MSLGLKLNTITHRLQNAIEILWMKKTSGEKNGKKTSLQKSIFSKSRDFKFKQCQTATTTDCIFSPISVNDFTIRNKKEIKMSPRKI